MGVQVPGNSSSICDGVDSALERAVGPCGVERVHCQVAAANVGMLRILSSQSEILAR